MSDNLLIGCGSGFSGDRLDAAAPVLDTLIARASPAVLMFETLGERTLALAQLARNADASAGYEPWLVELLAPVLAPAIAHGIPIVGNFGAANPEGAAHRIRQLARELEIGDVSVGVVRGDDVRERVSSGALEMWEDDDPGLLAGRDIIAANAYLGAQPIARALGAGCQIVVTGRVTDSALALGPLLHHFGWAEDDWDRLAAGVMAGHLLECGAQVTGGYFADPGFKDVEDLAQVGYPIAEIDERGTIVLTKADHTGGCVTERTVKEQLLYEIHDPRAYLTPDVILDMGNVTVREIDANRVQIDGARGRAPTEKLKVTISYQGDWLGEAEISYAGINALYRAQLGGRIVRERLADTLAQSAMRTDIIGAESVLDDNSSMLQARQTDRADGDFRLRLAVQTPDQSVAERAMREVLSLYCAGPAGGGGVRQHISRRLGTVSCLLPRTEVQASFIILEDK